MIRLRYLTLPVLAVLIVVSIVPFVSSDVIRGESTVPDWVKNTAGWWASDQIPDSAFLQGIQYLIKEGIVIVEIPTEIDSEAAEEVPGWVKNTAGWWAEDKIHDVTFVGAIKYLISQGTITVEQEVEAVEESVEAVEEIKDFYMEVNCGTGCVNWAYVNEEYRFEIATLDKKRGNYIDGVEINVKIISKGGELRQDLGAVTTEDGIYKSSITIPSMDWYAENILSVTGTYNGVEKTIEKEFTVFVKRSNLGPWIVTGIVAKDAHDDDDVLVSKTCRKLDGAMGVDTFTIGSNTFAIVASGNDHGVQIIDISNPAVIDCVGQMGDTEARILLGAADVDTFTIGSSTFAIVAALGENGVQIIDISDPTSLNDKDAETDGATFTELEGPYGVDTFVIGSSTFAIVASLADDGVQIIDISNPAVIVPKDAETDDDDGDFTELEGANAVETFTIGSSTYAIVASFLDDGVQMIDISNPAVIVAKDAETDGENGFTALDGAADVATFTIGSNTFAIVASLEDNGVQMIDISNPENIIAIDAETDGENGFTALNGADGVDTFTCGHDTYAIVTAANDNAAQLINISKPTDMVAIDAQTDGENGFTELLYADGVNIFTIGSSTYAIVASFLDDGVQIMEFPCHR